MNKTRHLLLAEMYVCVLVSLIIVVSHESETLMPGSLAAGTNAEFLATTVMEIITICTIPLSLRLFKFKGVSTALASGRERALAKWGSVRMLTVCLPMTANTLLYYLFGLNVAFGYMAIIGLICLLFIYPSKSRCATETGSVE